MLSPATRLGPVHLNVPLVERALPFYERALGLRVLARDDERASLGAGDAELVVLHERAGAQPAGRHAGLFHYALLVPARADLAHALLRLAQAGWQLTGASDHGVSEALYLHDPDGNGIEIYCDRPRDQWPWRGDEVEMFTLPLDLRGLLGVLPEGAEPAAAMAPGTTMGHVHLQVGDLDAAVRFHRDVARWDLMQSMGDVAAFLSAGGYHHHLGANVWGGVGLPPQPPGALGLRSWTVKLAGAGERAALEQRLSDAGVTPEQRDGELVVRDPAGVAVSFS